jgi:plasmid stabilization system protein ParE
VYLVIFTQAARDELIGAQDWYEGEASGLGRRFRQAMDALVGRMSDSPRQFPAVFKNVHGALLRRFPYSLLFVIEEDDLVVIAGFHASRDPSRWQKRPEFHGVFAIYRAPSRGRRHECTLSGKYWCTEPCPHRHSFLSTSARQNRDQRA